MSENKTKTAGWVILQAAVRPTNESRADRIAPNVTSLPRPNQESGKTAEFPGPARQFIQGDRTGAEKARMDLRPLCYEHHVPMKRVQLEKSTNPFTTYSLAYACPFPACLICYGSKTGYFAAEANDQSKGIQVLWVSCPLDGQPMYLAQFHPERTSLRLWRCGKPNCQGHLASEECMFEPSDPFIEKYLRTNR
jgi:hypothetical protein